MTLRPELRAVFASEHDRLRRLGTDRPLTEEELDQLFDLAAAIGYIDDEQFIPDRIIARLAVRLITGQVTPAPDDLTEPETDQD